MKSSHSVYTVYCRHPPTLPSLRPLRLLPYALPYVLFRRAAMPRARADDPTPHPQESFQFSLVHVRALSFVRDHHGDHTLRLDDRSGDRSPRVVSGRPRAAGCASPAPRRGVQGLIYEQEVCQASTHAPLYVYLLREEGRRRVRVEVPREEAVDKLGL